MTLENKKILVEVSPGELLDKISILEIKLDKIKDNTRLKEIDKEHKILKKSLKNNIEYNISLKKLCDKLKATNLKLWNIEDQVRICEKNKDFGEKFIELTRGVYFTNDQRSKIKSEINKLLKSNIQEVKEYVKY